MPADTDWGEVYRANVDAVCALARTLDAEQLSLVVPATPDWTVHDVLAHLAGSPADLLADRMDGAPSAAWTARHVAERAARSVDELVAEIQGSVDARGRDARGQRQPRHRLELRGPPRRPPRGARQGSAARGHVAAGPGGRVGPRMLGESADAVGDVPDYELFRAFFSRRSRTQMTGWGTYARPGERSTSCASSVHATTTSRCPRKDAPIRRSRGGAPQRARCELARELARGWTAGCDAGRLSRCCASRPRSR